MQITREFLQKELMGMRQEHNKVEAQLHTVDGAIQVLEQMIDYLDSTKAIDESEASNSLGSPET